MASLARQPWCVASGLLVPLLTLAAPAWLSLAGVGPAWAVLWLLPWSLADGRRSGLLAGLALGLLLDALQTGPVSQIPALLLLGWWWGRIGRLAPPIERSFNLALLALVGSLISGLSLMLQWALRHWTAVVALHTSAPGSGPDVQAALLAVPGWGWDDLAQAGVHILLAQTLLTALLAPMLCSLQLLLWRQIGSGWRG
jgi:rod shape-determining protein MreD